MRRLSFALAAVSLLSFSGMGTAVLFVAPPTPERLVEGHTVFSVLEVARNQSSNATRFAAAVAVLVREMKTSFTFTRFPGVLWFDDQYLVSCQQNGKVPGCSSNKKLNDREPCTGAVLAVQAMDPDPRLGGPASFNAATYRESYLIDDPNDHVWSIDKWDLGSPSAPQLVWTVAILGRDSGYSTPDDGACNGGTYADGHACGAGGPKTLLSCPDPRSDGGVDADNGTVDPDIIIAGAPGLVPFAKDPGDNGHGYPCDGCSALAYNAVLYFFLDDFTLSATPKDHTTGSADYNADVSGCQTVPVDNAWPCPAQDDHREGNSHPYNPGNPWPENRYAGRNNHGGSADCGGTPANDTDCHRTVPIDLYYGVAALPLARNYVLTDFEGSTAPYHCTASATFCDEEDTVVGDFT